MNDRHTKYVIEARDPVTNALALRETQPETFFGMPAITGITDDQMAKAIFRKIPDAVLSGESVGLWPRLINPTWTARRKTW